MWAAQYYKYTKPRTLLTSGGLGTMGYGLGALSEQRSEDRIRLSSILQETDVSV